MNPFIGEIVGFAGNYAPRGWALCDGQLLAINSNTALFSILGTTYGGDGRTTFALPDLRGRIPIHAGQGPGLTNRRLGQRFGTELNYMSILQMPNHNHQATLSITTAVGGITGAASATMNINNTASATEGGDGSYLGYSEGGALYNGTAEAGKALAADAITVDTSGLGINLSSIAGSATIGYTGNQQGQNNMQPVEVINFIIAMQGTYPPRS